MIVVGDGAGDAPARAAVFNDDGNSVHGKIGVIGTDEAYEPGVVEVFYGLVSFINDAIMV